MANTYEFPCEPGYRLHHGERVAKLAAEIRDMENLAVDSCAMRFGAIMHDIGKAGCPKGVSHAANGARIIERNFADILSREESSAISEIVARHCDRPNSKWYAGRDKPALKPEILAVQDADVLDHFGPSGIWLSLHWAAAKDASPLDTARYWFDSQQSNDWRAEAERSLNFESSRATLKTLVAEMNEFYRKWL
jgi:uncharacterized domain HDIG